MADNYKILAQDIAGGTNQVKVLYSVPENTQAAISSISLINSSDTNENYYLGVVKAEDVSSSSEIGVVQTRLVAYAFNSTIGAYSHDGVTWTQYSRPQSGYQWIVYGNGKFLLGGSGDTVDISSDGIS
jgi:hypothetical protein